MRALTGVRNPGEQCAMSRTLYQVMIETTADPLIHYVVADTIEAAIREVGDSMKIMEIRRLVSETGTDDRLFIEEA